MNGLLRGKRYARAIRQGCWGNRQNSLSLPMSEQRLDSVDPLVLNTINYWNQAVKAIFLPLLPAPGHPVSHLLEEIKHLAGGARR
jgi:hypothetical protein